MSKWTKQEVANKVDWEGGVISAIMWGLQAEDIEDSELSVAWHEAEELIPVIRRIQNLLPEPKDDYE